MARDRTGVAEGPQPHGAGGFVRVEHGAGFPALSDTPDIRPVDLSTAGLKRASELLRLVFPRARHLDSDYLAWQYLENPDGRVIGFEAFSGQQLLSHAVVLPLRARLHGELTRGVLSLNAATHPEAQRSGLYFDLANRAYAAAAEQGHGFGIAVTNDRSTPGFLKHVGFERLGSLEARVGLVSPRSTRDDGLELERVWDERSAAWRLACPTRRYTRGARRGDQREIHGDAGLPGVRVVLGTLPEAWCAGLGASPSYAARPLRLWVGCDPACRMPLSAPIPKVIRPSPLHLIFRDLTDRARSPDATRIRWRAIDFDDF